ncbi:signal transduction histidine kinase/ActR/RegA family two-component response regulator [Flavobacterium arsenatis]|uniref:histidine kinase n=1 Tax=Flavobacterium arsenatis TaxID=1484332 RepID=A0ABU1TNE6_9FLAO|nr:ATP-binding protein [Flavobacterium arsenatis]MDR6967501.1 signal transduction histidine kinase/ActR/RegA family two-component response regulator [Flavobacterium arsenatis]
MKRFITTLLFFAISFLYSQTPERERKSIEKQIIEAGVHYRKDNYEKSLELSKQALVRSFKINDPYLIAHSYNSIGVIYDDFSQSKRAIEFYDKALKYANKTENDSLKDWVYSNLGSAYYYNKIDVKKGIAYYKKSLFYAEKIKDSTEIAYTKLNLANAYFSYDDFDIGYEYLSQIRSYFENKGDAEGKFYLFNCLGVYYSSQGQNELAEDFFFKALKIGKKEQMDGLVMDVYENLSEHYKKYNQPKLAFVYEKKRKAVNDTLFSEKKLQSLEKYAIEIELDEYKSQFERIEVENATQQEKISITKTVSLLMFVILIVMLLLLYTFYKSNKLRKKLNAELTKANEELTLANKKAEENAELKNQFISTVSHELRTPLYGVVGIASIILEEHKKLVNNNHLHSLRFSARYLLALVNDILQISKMEENKIVLENSVFNLKEEINTIKNSLHFIADGNENTLTVELDPRIPKYLIGDELRLSQILMNLISNALKFTLKGEVKIIVLLDRIEGDVYFITFKVKDNGVGITKENQEKIFEKFVQLDRRSGDYQGTGLGLTIVKRLIELFESKIEVESQENKGTQFTFTIGFELAVEKVQPSKKMKQPISNLHILVVEDNKINQMVTQKVIERQKHTCKIVDNGHEAIEIVQQETFDAILMDINMPIIDGYETARNIRNLGMKIPIIALTAFDKNEVLKKATESGIDDVVIKPFSPTELFEVIFAHIQKNQE